MSTYHFSKLKVGEGWYVCASRWKEELDAGMAPPVVLTSIHCAAIELQPWVNLKQLAAIPNSERICVVSADQVPSVELDLNDKSGVSGSENFEFGIAEQLVLKRKGL